MQLFSFFFLTLFVSGKKKNMRSALKKETKMRDHMQMHFIGWLQYLKKEPEKKKKYHSLKKGDIIINVIFFFYDLNFKIHYSYQIIFSRPVMSFLSKLLIYSCKFPFF